MIKSILNYLSIPILIIILIMFLKLIIDIKHGYKIPNIESPMKAKISIVVAYFLLIISCIGLIDYVFFEQHFTIFQICSKINGLLLGSYILCLYKLHRNVCNLPQ